MARKEPFGGDAVPTELTKSVLDLSCVRLEYDDNRYFIFDGNNLIHHGNSPKTLAFCNAVYWKVVGEGYIPVVTGDNITFRKVS